MVRTGDQADDRVSRQIAPYTHGQGAGKDMKTLTCDTYCLAADVRMPHLGVELHYRRSERILAWYSNIDLVYATFVGRPWRTLERTFEVHQTIATIGRLC